jgi:hypothetical protein
MYYSVRLSIRSPTNQRWTTCGATRLPTRRDAMLPDLAPHGQMEPEVVLSDLIGPHQRHRRQRKAPQGEPDEPAWL